MPFALHVEHAARVIRAGGIVAYPTEAVYGLGCLPEDRAAVQQLLTIKKRSWRKGLLLVGATLEQLERYAVIEGSPCHAAILESWPGPITWVLPATSAAPAWITGGRPCVAVRMTAHPAAAALCRAAGAALVSTSANLTRHPPARSALRVRRQLRGKVDYVLPGRVGNLARPTAIRDGRTGSVVRPA